MAMDCTGGGAGIGRRGFGSGARSEFDTASEIGKLAMDADCGNNAC
jgi:hypothetical protein